MIIKRQRKMKYNNSLADNDDLALLYIYYRFIVCFPIGLDFLFITFTFLLHFLLSWTSSLSISSSAISASTLSNHVFLGLPTGLLPSTLYSIHFFTQSSSPFLITCPYHLSLPLLMRVVIGSTPSRGSNVYLRQNCKGVLYIIQLNAANGMISNA